MRQRGESEQPIKGRSANRAHKVSIAAPSIADLQNELGSLAREGSCTGVGAAIASAQAGALGRSAPVGSIPPTPRRLRDLLALSSDSP